VLRVLEPSAIAAILEPRVGDLRIGRDPECEIRIDDTLCSRFHARLVITDARKAGPTAVVQDLGSTNGTWVNNGRLTAPHTLRAHDKLRVGETLFSYLVLDELELGSMRHVVNAAMNDALTGLSNRWVFEEALGRELVRSRRYQWPLALLMIDLDKFKQVNDTYGHAAGDAVLYAVARLVDDGKRAFDLASRHGGEEMVLALPQTDGAGALVVAERLRAAIEALRVPVGEHEVRVTASIGIAVCGEAEATEIVAVGGQLGELYGAADAAMYRAKAAGRNRVVWLRDPTETR
jgi:two-component system cell cycle response regulator